MFSEYMSDGSYLNHPVDLHVHGSFLALVEFFSETA